MLKNSNLANHYLIPGSPRCCLNGHYVKLCAGLAWEEVLGEMLESSEKDWILSHHHHLVSQIVSVTWPRNVTSDLLLRWRGWWKCTPQKIKETLLLATCCLVYYDVIKKLMVSKIHVMCVGVVINSALCQHLWRVCPLASQDQMLSSRNEKPQNRITTTKGNKYAPWSCNVC